MGGSDGVGKFLLTHLYHSILYECHRSLDEHVHPLTATISTGYFQNDNAHILFQTGVVNITIRTVANMQDLNLVEWLWDVGE